MGTATYQRGEEVQGMGPVKVSEAEHNLRLGGTLLHRLGGQGELIKSQIS